MFIFDNDYKFMLIQEVKQDIHMHGGNNKEVIMFIEYLVYVYRNIKFVTIYATINKVRNGWLINKPVIIITWVRFGKFV
jgi:hypothetical protein